MGVFGMVLIAMFSMEQIFIGLDINVSTLCIILMYKWNHWLVLKLCCFCVKEERQSVSHLNIDVTKTNKRDSNTAKIQSASKQTNTPKTKSSEEKTEKSSDEKTEKTTTAGTQQHTLQHSQQQSKTMEVTTITQTEQTQQPQ